MRAIAIRADRRLEAVDVAPVPLRDHDVRIEVAFCGVCGSDLHYLEMPELGPPGTVMGHELSGTVVERGSAVDVPALGDRVAVLPIEPCGTCEACRRGFAQLCVERGKTRLGGRSRPGGFAESVAVPASSTFPLPDGLSARDAALVEPLAVGVHAVRLAALTPDDAAVVLGAGPIGAMTAIALRASGVERLVCVDVNPGRLRLIERIGIATAHADRAGAAAAAAGGSPAAVFDCTGHQSGIDASIALARTGGLIVVVGYASEPVPLDTYALLAKELRIHASTMYSAADFARAIEHLAAGRVPCDQIITAVCALEDAPSLVDDLRSGTTEQLKVLLRP